MCLVNYPYYMLSIFNIIMRFSNILHYYISRDCPITLRLPISEIFLLINIKGDCSLFFAEALLQSRPLPHIPALPEGDPPSSSSVQSISQQANVQQHASVSASGLLEAANRSGHCLSLK